MAVPRALRPADRPSSKDVGVAALLLAIGLLNLFLTRSAPQDLLGFESRLTPWGDYLALLALLVPIAWRRVAPALVCGWVGLYFVWFRLVEVPEGLASSLVVFLAIHAAGAHVADRRTRDGVRVAALAGGAVALGVGLLRDAEAVSFDGAVSIAFSIGINLAFYLTAWFLGDASRRRELDAEELARRADALAEEREKVAHQAVVEERVRIARELHDVVAHHVAVMGVQAAAARHVMDADPEGARAALGTVEESGRQAVEELQRLVDVLRDERPDAVDAPQPTLDGLEDLVASMRRSGVDAVVRRIGRARPLPASVELSAYRIVQEALTNVLRHAPGAEAVVVISQVEDGLQVEVVNGPSREGAVRAGPGGGRGLLGMRERAAMLGGAFESGVTARGGYRIRALLPSGSAHDVQPAVAAT